MTALVVRSGDDSSSGDTTTTQSSLVVAPATASTSAAPVTTPSTATTVATTPVTTPPATTLAPTTIATPRLEELYAAVQDGVYEVQASTCDGTGIGTGFLLSPTQLVTAAHVVDGTVSLAVVGPEGPIAGQVDGLDLDQDVALVHLDQPLTGHQFTLADAAPPVGATVVAIGFPLGQPKTLTVGNVSGVEREIMIDNGQIVGHLIQTDVAINPGNSGGPLLDSRGAVVGIVSAVALDAQGIGYAATASTAGPLLTGWATSPEPPPPPSCDNPLGPSVGSPIVTPPIPDQLSADVVTTFQDYFDGINYGDYERARERMVPEKRPSAEDFAAAFVSTYDLDIEIHSITATAEGAEAWVTFTSLQAADLGPRPGETCTDWSIDYTLVPADDGLFWISRATAHEGDPISQSCG